MGQIKKVKPFILLAVFSAVLYLCLKLIQITTDGSIGSQSVVILLSGFALISFIVLFVFFAGNAKNPEKGVLFTIAALGLKMLLSFIFALLFFMVFKKQDLASVILFFILYLGFTIFIVFLFRFALKKERF